MEISNIQVFALAWLLALALIAMKIKEKKLKKPNFPSGPKGLPIVGNLLQLGSLPHLKLHALAKTHGDIMLVKYGVKNVIVASSPKMAEAFLKTYDTVFASRPPLAYGKYTGYNYSDMAWAPYGPYWKLALGFPHEEYVLFCDSQSAIHLGKNPTFHGRSKHIDIRYHWIREALDWKKFELRKIHTDDNCSDMCTKALPPTKFKDLMPGGTDSSAVTVEWAIHELLKSQPVLAKLREELDSIIGRDRWVEEKDASDLPYLNAIVKETLRLHPLSPLLTPHYTLDDCKVAGYDIPKNTVVIVNAWSIGRRPDCWDDPYDFRPERFLEGKEYGLNGQSFSLLPFGSGRRRCPGYGLALKLVPTTIANVLHGFDWKFVDGMKPDDICMVERNGLTTCPEIPVSVIPEPRLPLHLYGGNIAA